MQELGAVIVAVGHRAFREKPLAEILKMLAPNGCLIDVKSILDIEEIKRRGVCYWRL